NGEGALWSDLECFADLLRRAVLQRPDDRDPIGGRAHPLGPGRELEAERPFGRLDLDQPGCPQQGAPLATRAIAYVRGITKQLDALHECIDERILVAESVDDERTAACRQH